MPGYENTAGLGILPDLGQMHGGRRIYTVSCSETSELTLRCRSHQFQNTMRIFELMNRTLRPPLNGPFCTGAHPSDLVCHAIPPNRKRRATGTQPSLPSYQPTDLPKQSSRPMTSMVSPSGYVEDPQRPSSAAPGVYRAMNPRPYPAILDDVLISLREAAGSDPEGGMGVSHCFLGRSAAALQGALMPSGGGGVDGLCLVELTVQWVSATCTKHCRRRRAD